SEAPGFAVDAHPHADEAGDILAAQEAAQFDDVAGELDGDGFEHAREIAGVSRTSLNARREISAVDDFAVDDGDPGGGAPAGGSLAGFTGFEGQHACQRVDILRAAEGGEKEGCKEPSHG